MLRQNKNKILISVIAMGCSSIVTQIIILREFLSVFYGNELVIGIILSNWMLITGFGSYFEKHFKFSRKKYHIIIFQICIAVLPLVSVFLINYLKNIVFPAGSMNDIFDVFLSSFIILLPYCFINGMLFTLLCDYYSDISKSNKINKVYSFESLGSIVAGLIYNLILIFVLESFQSLTIICIINLSAALFLSVSIKKNVLSIGLIFLILISIVSLFFDIDKISKGFLFSGQKIVYRKDTPFGNLIVTKLDNQINFFENGVLLFATDNVINNEELVHYAMVQHKNPKNILLISGGFSGVFDEILKYKIHKIDYLEINPYIVDAGKKYTNFKDNPKINIINIDACLFLKQTKNLYDIILINLPEPATAQINRYYTVEFFKNLKTKLSDNGVVITGLQSVGNYISKEAAKNNSILYSSVKIFFKNILIIPGQKNYFILSDNNLTYNIPGEIKEKKITNSYVNEFYIDTLLLKARSEYILSNINKNEKQNKNFKPVLYFNELRYWLSYFKENYFWFFLMLLIIIILAITRVKFITLGLFTAGFSSSAIEIIILFSFQVIYGYIYQMTGIIISIFMAGLFLGALFLHKYVKTNIKNYAYLQFSIGVFSAVLPLVLLVLDKYSYDIIFVKTIFFLVTLIISTITGIIFTITSKLQKNEYNEIAANSYSADLFGGAVGALLVSALLIPLLGINNVCIFISILNFLIGIIILMKRKRKFIF